MKASRIVLAITSVVALAACVVAPVEEAAVEEPVGEGADSLVFASGDRDITWSGPASYGAPWAQQFFNPYPGLYIFDNGQQNVHGAVYLSPGTVCRFAGYQEANDHLYVTSTHCSGPYAGLQVSLDCLKQPGQLSCVGNLQTGSGAQSSMSGTIAREVICAPDGCYTGPKEPGPSGPNGPADCPKGQSPCGPSGCCAAGERCGDGKCYVPEKGDELKAVAETQASP